MLWETFISKAFNLEPAQFCALFPDPLLIFSPSINDISNLATKLTDTPEGTAVRAPTRLDLFTSKKNIGFFPKTVLFLEEGTPILIGRDKNCQMVLPLSEISRQHARITGQAKIGWILTDRCSRNGTLLNEKRCASGQPYLLHDGDIINFGSQIQAEFKMPETLCRELGL